VEYIRAGDPPGTACRKAIQRLKALVPLQKIGNQGTKIGKPTKIGNLGTGAGSVQTSVALSQDNLGSQDTMHSTLVVGVVAMDAQGNVSVVCVCVCVFVCVCVCV
jgi:hypothetical protein